MKSETEEEKNRTKQQSGRECSQQICNNPKLETIQMSFNGWMFRETMVYQYHKKLLRNYPKKNKLLYLQQVELISGELCWVKKANLKRLYSDYIYRALPYEEIMENRLVVGRD